MMVTIINVNDDGYVDTVYIESLNSFKVTYTPDGEVNITYTWFNHDEDCLPNAHMKNIVPSIIEVLMEQRDVILITYDNCVKHVFPSMLSFDLVKAKAVGLWRKEHCEEQKEE